VAVTIDNGAVPPSTPAPADAQPSAVAKSEKDKKKKKRKARDAWISFAGRIVAQFVGAAATIFLGIYFVSRSSPAKEAARQAAPRPESAVSRGVPRTGAISSIAVLPLQNFSGDPGQEYFADGMTEALIADLAQVKGLRVISRTSSMQYKNQSKPLPQVAQELGVGLVVEGSVARSGDRIRVTAQLIDAEHDEHLWARTYDRKSHDVLGLQAEVAAAIVGEVKGVAAAQRPAPVAEQPVNPAAYDLYLRGRHAWNGRTPQGFVEARRYFDEAIRQDPTFALAHAGLADTYQLSGGLPSLPDAAAQARASAERALELDDGLAEAHTSLAGVFHRVDHDIEGAEREFRRALELNPGYATAHQWYSILLAEDGRDADAVRQAEEAVTLDPLSGPMRQTLGLVHYYGRRFDRVVADERRALELAPHLPLARDILARALVATGRPKDAIAVMEKQSEPRSGEALATLSIAYARAGQRPRAMVLVDELRSRQPVPRGALARWYIASGNHSSALELLESLVSDNSPVMQLSLVDPALDPLRSEPRFQDIVRRVKAQNKSTATN
jgi:TolB-like protein/Tfp pilus assembly protein PilF